MIRALAAAVLAWPALAAAGDGFYTLEGHGGPIMGLAVAADGRIATASFDNSVGLWDHRSPIWFEGHEAAVNAVLFLPGGGLASAGDDFDVILWGPEGHLERRLEGHAGKVMALAVSPDGQTLASASWDGSVGLWPLAGGAPRFLKGHDAGVNDVLFLADGRLLSASVDGTIRLWDVDTGAEERVLVKNGFGINAMLLDEGDGWLAYGTVDGVTRVVDPEGRREIADFTLDRRPILAMARDPEGRRIAVGDGEGYIMVIDTAGWTLERDFHATTRGPVWALGFSPDGGSIEAGGLEPVVYSWPVADLGDAPAIPDGGQSFLRDPEEMDNGERQFARKCSICHSLTPGSARRAGPTLYGLFGRPAGSVPDYPYSGTLAEAGIIWSAETIDALFDEGPAHYIPGSKMPMQRIAGEDDRADLIDYLRRATDPERQKK